MANRFFSPNQQFADSTGLPYANGTLAFYASGTSTPLATYSDSALTIANTNPVVLDAAGRAGNIFLQNLAYKVVLSDANNNPIWTDDPVFSSDYSARAKLTTGSGSPNGNTAGTAGSPGIGADTYWDSTNNILYVCTTTGSAASAVWTAVNATAAAAITPAPQGYLTPTSGTPIISSDVIGQSSLVYTPYAGNLVPIYNGTGFTPTVFSELTLTLTSSQAANTIYDVLIFNNSGVLTLVTGPAWTSSAAGSCVRGTGAGTSQLSRISGIWVNSVQITGRNGASTYTIPANQATYLGSIFIDSVAGQITLHRSFGQSRKWAIWNCYNRAPLYLKAGDGTTSWTAGASLGPANANTANSLTVFTGLTEEICDFRYASRAQSGGINANSAASFQIGIGVNSTSVGSGRQATSTITSVSSNLSGVGFDFTSEFISPPTFGINVATALERNFGSGNIVVQGSEANTVLIAQWRG